MFMFLVTMPVLMTLLLTERTAIPLAIARAESAGVLTPPTELKKFCDTWEAKYRVWNVIALCAAVPAGIVATIANYHTTNSLTGRSWAFTDLGDTDGATINAAGWVFLLWQIPAFYGVCTIYVIRGATTIRFLVALVRESNIVLRPFHPDRAAGLRPIGGIGLRNQLLLMAGGFNMLCLLLVATKLDSPEMRAIVAAAAAVYILFCPIVFLGPLLPFRRAMLSARREFQERIDESLCRQFTTMMGALDQHGLTEQNRQNLDYLQSLKKIADRIPVWPFDSSTLAKFLFAYGSPLATAGIGFAAQQFVSFVTAYLKGQGGG